MKSTRLMSNAAPLKKLAQRCRHDHQHVVLQGSLPAAFGGGPRTRAAQAYPSGLCRAWAKAVAEACLPARVPARWRRLIELYRAGDVERHPGPARRTLAVREQRAGVDLLVVDVSDSTRAIYEQRLEEFAEFYVHRGFARP